MAPKYNLNHVSKNYPFMSCVVKVNTQSNWQKTVAKVLNKCHGVYSFRMGDNGEVEISGTVDPSSLLKMLGKAGPKTELRWLQFGECSSNLFMPMDHRGFGGSTYSQDGRYQQDYYGDYGYTHSYDYQSTSGYAQGGTVTQYNHSIPTRGGSDKGCCRVM